MSSLLLLIFIFVFIAFPALVAHGKGRSFWGWFFFALILWPLAFVACIVISTDYRALDRRNGVRHD